MSSTNIILAVVIPTLLFTAVFGATIFNSDLSKYDLIVN
jgi:hypothetical protein